MGALFEGAGWCKGVEKGRWRVRRGQCAGPEQRPCRPKGETAYGYLVEGSAGIEGYLFLTRRSQPHSLLQELNLTDLIALTPAAGRRLLSFIGDHRSLAREVVWRGGPADPLLFLLREQSYAVRDAELRRSGERAGEDEAKTNIDDALCWMNVRRAHRLSLWLNGGWPYSPSKFILTVMALC